MTGILRVSSMSDTDFLLTLRMKKHQLAGIVRNMSLTQAMDYRRDLQMAGTSYFRRNPGDFGSKDRMLVVCATIEKWCRNAYFSYHMPRTQRLHPDWARMTVKIEVKKEWEALVKKNSY